MAQQAPNQNNLVMIRPQFIDGLPGLGNEQRTHYKNGLAGLWQTVDSTPAGSPQHQDAENKIRQASVKIMQTVSSRSRPQSGGGPRPASNHQGGPSGGNMPQQTPQQGNQQPQQQPQQPQQNPLSQALRNELGSVKVEIPPHISTQGEQVASNWRTQFLRKGAALLQRRDRAKQQGQALTNQRNHLQRTNQPIPDQMQQDLHKFGTEMQAASAEWESIKRQNANLANSQGQNMQRGPSGQGQAGPQQQRPPPQQQMQPQQQQQMNGTPQGQDAQQMAGMSGPGQQGEVKMGGVDQPTAESPAQRPNSGFQQPQPPIQQAQPTQPPPQQNINQQRPPSAHPQQTPQPPPQQQPQQGYPQGNMGPQQPGQQRPQMNPQQMPPHGIPHQQPQNAPTPGMAQGVPQQQQPSQQHQQPQQPQQPQRPQVLSHQAAVENARQSYTKDQAQKQQQQGPQPNSNQPQVPNGLPLSGPPQNAQQQTPTSTYSPMQQQTQQGSGNTKFPIPKTLNLDPRTQMPVPGPPQRPTAANAGMMNTPGVQRAAQFTLEGFEGDRVLSKRKLDELVRQVTGGTEDGALAPEVEEAVLTLMDDFVDNLIVSACRLAKLRSGTTLDVKDLQIVLERNYGMRIPGYALDEVRTVRKFQPAPGWQTKMQAVQAGKVMGNRES